MKLNKIIKIYEFDENERKKILNFLKEELLNGKIIICGTDTLYGISANALDENAVKKVYKIKKRDFNKPLSICVKNKEEIEKYAYVNDLAKKIIDEFLPGPLTIILKKKPIIPDIVAKDYIGIRIPDEAIIRELSIVPLTTTSANISGEKSPTAVEEINPEILKKVDYVVDIGKCKYSKPSTIIKIEDNKIIPIREGAIPISKIKEMR
ncbi:L-threonylcarbamoyladenylate synthase [Methanocaldococcus fervens]|uniref:L-threonylcarbamoyladenylate synthase n=1 Tax=Methanocaldococcus fervens (strain DSM 4213 / JCM 15782 / AG86) TaxID=573064 RepID=C7P8S1_METFA|nr:L-threonylcarbamoyladenylate synthase [Methanocaldococcus fervens]ACV24953.1 Sua5/YciO/YrdC/YwlC family protein [Methanocaldococcus fervens AG86]